MFFAVKNTFPFKFLALFLAVSILLSTEKAFAAFSPSPEESSAFNARAFLDLPQSLGRIQSSYFPKNANGPFVIHIQDAHANPQAQEAIEKILDWLNLKIKEKKLSTALGLEGAAGEIRPDYLNFFSQYAKANAAIVNSLFEQGELSGAERWLWKHTNAQNESAMPVLGVESADLFRKNLNLYRRLRFSVPQWEKTLDSLERLERSASNRILSKELANLLERYERIQKGNAQGADLFFAYLNYLSASVQSELGLNLNHPIEQLRFPQITRVLAAQQLEKQIDHEKAEKLRKEWSEKLSQAGYPTELLTLLNHPQKMRNLRWHYEQLLKEMKRREVFVALPKEVQQEIGFYILQSELDAKGFDNEVGQLSVLLAQAYAKTEKEKSFLKLWQDFQLYKKLNRAELTREDYFKVRAHFKRFRPQAFSRRFQELAERKEKNANSASLDLLNRRFEDAIRFYRMAERRDKALYQNFYAFAKNANVGILISGGFHTDGLMEMMQHKTSGYIVIAPAVSALGDDQVAARVYEDENVRGIQRSGITKQEGLFLKSLVETGLPNLKEEGLLEPQLREALAQSLQRHPVLRGKFKISKFESLPITQDRKASFLTRVLSFHVPPALLLGSNYAQVWQPLPVRDRADLLKGLGLIRTDRSELRTAGNGYHFGTVGINAGLPTAIILGGAGYKGRVIAPKEVRERFNESKALDPLMLQHLSRAGKLRFFDDTDDEIKELVAEEDSIYIDEAEVPGESYNSYLDRIYEQARRLGEGLRLARNREDLPKNRKTFILRGEVGIETTQRVYDIIKWHAHPQADEDLNFDVVFQPDQSLRDEDNKNLVEPFVVFGLREDNPLTKDALKSLYSHEKLRSVDVVFTSDFRSAKEAEDDKLIYLATRLAHINSLAYLADKYNADLSVVAASAGRTKRMGNRYINPSLGFGGRLLSRLRGIRTERLSRAAGRRNIPFQTMESNLEQAVTAYLRGEEDVEKILKNMDRDIHLLFWLEVILKMNEGTIDYFYSKILTYNPSLRDKTVTVLGVAYSKRTGQITDSPALALIHNMIKKNGVTKFIIADPYAETAFRAWLKEKQKRDADYRGVTFLFETNLYTAVSRGDLSIIATDSNPDLYELDLSKLAVSLNGKILYDGINLMGLRADGKLFYSFEQVRRAHERVRSPNTPISPINYVSVGRPSIGPRFGDPGNILRDSQLYTKPDEYPVRDFAQHFVTSYGGGYVGLVLAANQATLGPGGSTEGNIVTIKELPALQARVEALESDETRVPIYEPDLREKMVEGKRQETGKKRTLYFTTQTEEALKKAEIIFLAVGTPQIEETTEEQQVGEIDLSQILDSAREIASYFQAQRDAGIQRFPIIMVKSTVTPDTFEKIVSVMREKGFILGLHYAVGSNPEFLREGEAMGDVTKPDLTVIGIRRRFPPKNGTNEEEYASMIQQMQRNFALAERINLEIWYNLMVSHPHSIVVTDEATSVLTKYLINSLSQVTISFANVAADDASYVDADYPGAIKPILRKDPRIGLAFLDAGCGYGGSCFPKDVRALVRSSQIETGHTLHAVVMADAVNDVKKEDFANAFVARLSNFPNAHIPLAGKTLAVWGMTFKPRTDDMREASSATVVARWLRKGAAQIRIHDPILNMLPPEAPAREVSISRYIAALRKVFLKYKMYQEPPADPNDNQFVKDQKRNEQFEQFFRKRYIETNRVVFVDDPMDAVRGSEKIGEYASGLALITEWATYKPSLSDVIASIPPDQPLVIGDGRNIWADRRDEMAAAGNIEYFGAGARSVHPANLVRSELRLPAATLALPTTDFIARIDQSKITKPALTEAVVIQETAANAGNQFSLPGIANYVTSASPNRTTSPFDYAVSFVAATVLKKSVTITPFNEAEKTALNTNLNFTRRFGIDSPASLPKEPRVLLETVDSDLVVDRYLKAWLGFLAANPTFQWVIDGTHAEGVVARVTAAASEWNYQLADNQILSASVFQNGKTQLGYLLENEDPKRLSKYPIYKYVAFRKIVTGRDSSTRAADRFLAAERLLYPQELPNAFEGPVTDLAPRSNYENLLHSLKAYASLKASA